MNRRGFLMAGCAGVLVGAPRPYPEAQSPTSPRGRALAEMTRSLRIERNIVYARRGGDELRLHVYAPPGPASRPRPVVLCFSLAAWMSDGSDWRPDLDNMMPAPTPNIFPAALAARGYVVIGAQLRTARQAVFPAQIQDAQCAFAWVLDHASERGFDVDRIALLGASASGHMVSLLGLMNGAEGLTDASCRLPWPLPVRAICSFAGFYDFEYYQQDPGDGSLQPQITQFLGGSFAERPEVYRAASPRSYVRRGAPPVFMFHGLQDTRVPFSQAVQFEETLRGAGVPVEFLRVNHYGHGPLRGELPDPGYEVIDEHIYRFFDRRVKGGGRVDA